MVYLEKLSLHEVTAANYVTNVNPTLHPDRILNEHDFLYMLEGDWEIFEGSDSYEMKSDDLLILSASRHHYGKSLCNPGNRHMYIHVLPTPSEQAAERNTIDTSHLFLCDTLVHCQHNPQIRHYFHEIIALQWSHTPEQKNRLSLLFSLLLCELSEMLTLPTVMTISDSIVKEISELVRTTPQFFFSASEIAAKYYICERTLNNRFQKALGKTFYSFQLETHMEMVRQFLLTQPRATLRETALNYGFYDEFHLSKVFKKTFGISPSEYRKSCSM